MSCMVCCFWRLEKLAVGGSCTGHWMLLVPYCSGALDGLSSTWAVMFLFQVTNHDWLFFLNSQMPVMEAQLSLVKA